MRIKNILKFTTNKANRVGSTHFPRMRDTTEIWPVYLHNLTIECLVEDMQIIKNMFHPVLCDLMQGTDRNNFVCFLGFASQHQQKMCINWLRNCEHREFEVTTTFFADEQRHCKTPKHVFITRFSCDSGAIKRYGDVIGVNGLYRLTVSETGFKVYENIDFPGTFLGKNKDGYWEFYIQRPDKVVVVCALSNQELDASEVKYWRVYNEEENKWNVCSRSQIIPMTNTDAKNYVTQSFILPGPCLKSDHMGALF